MPYINCQACNFWYQKEQMSGDMGQCRKYAPQPYHNPPPQEHSKAHWPQTDADDGCGQGEIKAQQQRSPKGKAA